MRKSSLKKLLLIFPLTLFAVFLTLALFGRSVGPKPLPWKIAWLGPFGDFGYNLSVEWAIEEADTKQEIIEVLGMPDMLTFDDDGERVTKQIGERVKAFDMPFRGYEAEQTTEVDVFVERDEEAWLYWAGREKVHGRAIIFRKNRVWRK